MTLDKDFQTRSFRITTRVVQWSCIVGLILIGVAVSCSFLLPLMSNAMLSSRVTLGKLSLVNVCVLFGIFQSLLGVLLILLGITSSYSVQAEAEKIKFSLAAASPGILLMFISTCLIWISLRTQFSVTETQEFVDPTSPIGNANPQTQMHQTAPTPLGVKGPD